MNCGFENDKWYVDYTSCNRPVGTVREEHDKRAIEIAETSNNIMLSMTGGTDSQVMALSFLKQNIPFEAVFMYLPGYNDHEYKQLQEIERKFGFKSQVIDIDPYAEKEDLEAEAKLRDIQVYSILQKRFLSLVPDDCDFVSNIHDPYIHIDDNNRPYWFQGYNSYEGVRQRAFELVERKGKFLFWGDTSEMLASILSDEVIWSCNHAWPYMRANGLSRPGHKFVDVHGLDKWDYFIKPFLYGKHWKDELIYFPKSQGLENIPFALTFYPMFKHGMFTPLREFVDFLLTGNGETRRYYETNP